MGARSDLMARRLASDDVPRKASEPDASYRPTGKAVRALGRAESHSGIPGRGSGFGVSQQFPVLAPAPGKLYHPPHSREWRIAGLSRRMPSQPPADRVGGSTGDFLGDRRFAVPCRHRGRTAALDNPDQRPLAATANQAGRDRTRPAWANDHPGRDVPGCSCPRCPGGSDCGLPRSFSRHSSARPG